MRQTLLLLAVVVGIGASPAAHGTSIANAGSDCDEPLTPEERAEWESLLAAVDVLERGTRQEKLALFEHDGYEVGGPFDFGWPAKDCDSLDVQRMIQRVRDWAREESDVWLIDLAAGNIVGWGHDAALPLFQDLSRHAAPSLRARAVEQASWMDDEDSALDLLLAMWQREREPWVMALLLPAIDDLADGDTDPAAPPYDRCVELIRHRDPELAEAALVCALDHELPGAQSALLDLVEGASAWRQTEALRQLRVSGSTPDAEALRRLRALWGDPLHPATRADVLRAAARGDAPFALEWARELIASEDPRLALPAVERIAASADPADRARLLRVAGGGAPTIRAAAIGHLGARAEISEFEPILVDALAPSAPTPVRAAALGVVARATSQYRIERWLATRRGDLEQLLDVPESLRPVLPLVERIAGDDPDEALRAEALSILSDGSANSGNTVYCGPSRPAPRVRLAPPEPDATLRCHAGPDVDRAPALALRRTRGAEGWPTARFDDGRNTWWMVLFDDDERCWIPEDQLVRQDPTAENAEPVALDAPTPEFDLPLDAAGAEAFLRLEGSGVLARFDPGREVTGVRLQLDGADAEDLAALLALAIRGDGALGQALASRVSLIAERSPAAEATEGVPPSARSQGEREE